MPSDSGRNVPGAFYVDPDCCMTCGIPVAEAPEVFAWDDTIENGPCYVHRQPATDAEFAKVLNAIRYADIDCIRYRGANAVWRQRLLDEGFAEQCDPPSGEREK